MYINIKYIIFEAISKLLGFPMGRETKSGVIHSKCPTLTSLGGSILRL